MDLPVVGQPRIVWIIIIIGLLLLIIALLYAVDIIMLLTLSSICITIES